MPNEVINLHVVALEKLEERISAVGTIHANTIETTEASIRFIPDNKTPEKEEILSWIWTFRPDLGDEILKHNIEPDFKKLIECYRTEIMDDFWKYMTAE